MLTGESRRKGFGIHGAESLDALQSSQRKRSPRSEVPGRYWGSMKTTFALVVLLCAAAGCFGPDEPPHLQVELVSMADVALDATIRHNGNDVETVSVAAMATVTRTLDADHSGVHTVVVTWRETGSSRTSAHEQQVNLDDQDCPDPTVITFPVQGTRGAFAALDATDDC